jgi:hypothetical protein
VLNTGLVFFRHGEIGGYRADRACYLAISGDKFNVHLAIYEPSWQDCMLRIELPFSVAADNLPENVQLSNEELLIAVKRGKLLELDISVE